MSYPSSLDLAFGSEKAAADPISPAVELMSDSSLPKTQEELNELIQLGLASECSVNASFGMIDNVDPEVSATLPQNLKGIVVLDEGTPVRVKYTVENGEVIVQNYSDYVCHTLYLILKQAVD